MTLKFICTFWSVWEIFDFWFFFSIDILECFGEYFLYRGLLLFIKDVQFGEKWVLKGYSLISYKGPSQNCQSLDLLHIFVALPK